MNIEQYLKDMYKYEYPLIGMSALDKEMKNRPLYTLFLSNEYEITTQKIYGMDLYGITIFLKRHSGIIYPFGDTFFHLHDPKQIDELISITQTLYLFKYRKISINNNYN